MDESASSIKNASNAIQQNINISLTKKVTKLQKNVLFSLMNTVFDNLSSRVGVAEGSKGNFVDIFA